MEILQQMSGKLEYFQLPSLLQALLFALLIRQVCTTCTAVKLPKASLKVQKIVLHVKDTSPAKKNNQKMN